MPGEDPRSSQDPFEQLAAETGPQKAKGRGPGLKARAVGLLSRREHSRLELERKLAPHAADAAELQQTLDHLEREGWLSNERFAQALADNRAQRQGTARIVHDLKQHGIDEGLIANLRANLLETEAQRARQVWEKKFNRPPADAREYARQFRFLASRGFSPDCLRRILGDSHGAP